MFKLIYIFFALNLNATEAIFLAKSSKGKQAYYATSYDLKDGYYTIENCKGKPEFFQEKDYFINEVTGACTQFSSQKQEEAIKAVGASALFSELKVEYNRSIIDKTKVEAALKITPFATKSVTSPADKFIIFVKPIQNVDKKNLEDFIKKNPNVLIKHD